MAFTKTTKRSIDLGISGLIAGLVLVYFIYRQKDRNLPFLIFSMVMSFAISYLIVTRITKAIFEATLKKDVSVPVDSVKVIKQADGTSATVSTASSIDISLITRRLRDDLYDTPWNGHSSDLWWQLANLSDTDIANVYNEWNKSYFGEYSESLISAIQDESFDALGLIDNRAYIYKETVLSRLFKIGAK